MFDLSDTAASYAINLSFICRDLYQVVFNVFLGEVSCIEWQLVS